MVIGGKPVTDKSAGGGASMPKVKGKSDRRVDADTPPGAEEPGSGDSRGNGDSR